MLKTRFMHFDSNGPSYDYATRMFNIKSSCYQRINCETFFKLWSEKCKMLCFINHDILVTMLTKRTRWLSGTLKEDSLYQIRGKFTEWKLPDRIILRVSFIKRNATFQYFARSLINNGYYVLRSNCLYLQGPFIRRRWSIRNRNLLFYEKKKENYVFL